MDAPNLPGWATLKAPAGNKRWAAVKDARIAPLPGAHTAHDIHIWVRRNVSYWADVGDEWQLPGETLTKRKGDCEDMAILERALLIAAGFPSSDIWLLIAYDMDAHETHAMLLFERFLIDSRTDKIMLAAGARDYTPIIAFSDDRAVTFGRAV